MRLFNVIFINLSFLFLFACNSAGKLEDLGDLALDPPSRKQIDRSKVGTNNFFINREAFGSVDQQFSDIQKSLKIPFVRILLEWSDGVQADPTSALDLSFADSILDKIPAGVDVLIVLNHLPSWMANSANWIDGDPRKTFVQKFITPVVTRYAGRRGIIGWEIWNEPDFVMFSPDEVMGLTEPSNYFELLKQSYEVIRAIDPAKLVVMAATRSIQQNYPSSFNYNKTLKDLGAVNYTDVWNIHYYGKQYEKVVVNGGIADFLKGIGKPIWVTESGEQGPNNQLAYVEEVWPFLSKEIPAIDRFYYYIYASAGMAQDNFAMRSTDSAFPVSDLYVYLRDNQP
jgi:hypothetical protein